MRNGSADVRQAFAQRLRSAMVAKGWNQSQLGRQADISRDNISGYMRGKTLPLPAKLAQLAQALDVAEDDLLPESEAVTDDRSDIVVRSTGNETVQLQINRCVSTKVAAKILDLLGDASS